MSHEQRHRGQHPKDSQLFAAENLPSLKHALRDYSWLLSEGYATNASLKLVGDKFELSTRQRLLLMRCACTKAQQKERKEREVKATALEHHDLYLDGFNILITIESTLSGGFIFRGMDGCYRDMASVHGSYKRVQETKDAILLIGKVLETLKVRTAYWLLDKPVSNSGRLKMTLLDLAQANGWAWQVELRNNPDAELERRSGIVATTDGVVLDAVGAWFNLTWYIIEHFVPNGKTVALAE